MMISQAMQGKLNEQIGHEFGASHAYMAMACWFEQRSLNALGKRFRQQSAEEREHAIKIIDYLLEVGARPKLGALAEPKADYANVPDVIAAALEQEKTVTSQINALVDLADKENDHATRSFLQWFVDEQVEEVSSMQTLLDVAKMAGSNLLQLEAYVRHTLEKD